MKKNLTILLGLIVPMHVFSQISLSHEYNYQIHLMYIDQNLPKIIYYNRTDTVEVYNMDHTIYTSFVIPFSYSDTASGPYGLYYVSRTLFDCDSTNIEYLLSRLDAPYYVRVLREDGTVLFYEPGYSFTNLANILQSTEARMESNIINYGDGSMMRLTESIGGGNIRVYDLCGRVPGPCCNTSDISTQIQEVDIESGGMSLYPNPTRDRLNVHYELPSGDWTARYVISNGMGQTVQEGRLGRNMDYFILDVANWIAGQYIVNIYSDNGDMISEQFIKVSGR